jgi:signal transduction histidine kinase
LNRQAISITGISDRLKLFIQKIKESYPNVEIRLNENITKDISLTPEQSLNLLRILQEGLNNALKHSNADVISIDINSHDDLKISITDNGIGFISANSKGYGIDNMKARAKESGFQLYFKQTQPKGTEMMLTADTKN